jgi:nucleoside-diphosphate-sugar epimerase
VRSYPDNICSHILEGFQLAKTLKGHPKIDSITILQDEGFDPEKEPFKSYGTDIPEVDFIRAPLGDDAVTKDTLKGILDGKQYEYIWDNYSKKPEGASKALCEAAQDWGVKLYTYVSSAGIYKPNDSTVFPMAETTPIKDTAGQALFDSFAVECGLPLVSFRPQYIYGPKANKYDYIDWYFDRLVRDLPLPIPGDGTQKVSLTNSEDVASILASVLNDEAAAVAGRFFNCGTDDLHSYAEVAFMCAEAAGIAKDDVKIEYYDGDKLGKAKFPFRLTNFYVAPDKVKAELGWKGPKHSLKGDLPAYFEGYKARGGPEKKISLAKDWEVIFGNTSPYANQAAYEKYDPSVLETA